MEVNGLPIIVDYGQSHIYKFKFVELRKSEFVRWILCGFGGLC